MSCTYQIRLSGQLDPSWAETLGGAALVWDDEDNTILTCELVDESALYGVLARLFDLGCQLLSVTRDPQTRSTVGDIPEVVR
jgi:hypothetical protein